MAEEKPKEKKKSLLARMILRSTGAEKVIKGLENEPVRAEGETDAQFKARLAEAMKKKKK
jgi:hypothetical protein